MSELTDQPALTEPPGEPGAARSGRPSWVLLLPIAALTLAGIGLLVFSPTDARPSGYVVEVAQALARHGAPSWLADTDLWEILANIVLFVPLGLLGALVAPRVGLLTWLLAGLALSGSVEVVQAVFLPARDGSVVDILDNTMGLVLGALLGRLALRVAGRTVQGRPGRPA